MANLSWEHLVLARYVRRFMAAIMQAADGPVNYFVQAVRFLLQWPPRRGHIVRMGLLWAVILVALAVFE